MLTAIIDYESGNLHSAHKAFERMARDVDAGAVTAQSLRFPRIPPHLVAHKDPLHEDPAHLSGGEDPSQKNPAHLSSCKDPLSPL